MQLSVEVDGILGFVAVLRFEFGMDPVDQVPSWGGDRPTLHWFGLSSGWYYISVEGGQLLRYTGEAVRRWELERPYPNYFVVRLWEDLLVLRWALEEPVPGDVVPFVDGTFARHEFPEDAEWSDAVDIAFGLQSDFQVYTGYLTEAPRLICWRHLAEDRDVVTLCQEISPNDRGTFDGPPRLEVTMPATEFFSAVEEFDRQFIAAMEERVAELERHGPPAGVDIDLDDLRREHGQRSRWLAKRMAEPRTVDWDAVRTGIAEISSWPLAGNV